MRFGLREIIFLIVLLSVPVASFVFVFKPRNDEIRTATKEVEVKTAKLERLREVSARIENISAAIDEWHEALEFIEGKLPSEQGIDEILEQVWNLTEENGLEIVSTHADPAVPTATYMELPLKIEMQGDFDGFYQFLLDLEQQQRITRIHQLIVSRADAKKTKGPRGNRNAPKEDELPEGTMHASFTLSIYYEPTQRRQPSHASASDSKGTS